MMQNGTKISLVNNKSPTNTLVGVLCYFSTVSPCNLYGQWGSLMPACGFM